MPDLIEVSASVEARLLQSERSISDVRIALARVETKMGIAADNVKEFRQENIDQYRDLKSQLGHVTHQLEPLKEAKWKASGAYTVMAAVVSAVISITIKFWK